MEVIIGVTAALLAVMGVMWLYLHRLVGALTSRKHLLVESGRLHEYNRRLLELIDLQGKRHLEEIIESRCGKHVILFGYNQVARFLIGIMQNGGFDLKFIVENDPVRRQLVEKNFPGLKGITTEQLLDIAPGHGEKNPRTRVIICVLHDKMHRIAWELRDKAAEQGTGLDIVLLDDMITGNNK